MIWLLAGIILIATSGILLYRQRLAFHETDVRLRALQQELVELRADLTRAVTEMEALVQFFNQLPPESSIKAGSDDTYHMRLPDRMKLDLS